VSSAGSSVTIPKQHDVADGVLALRPGALWNALRRQPLAAWAVYAYLFFEYLRPQSIYPSLNILPLARLSLLTAVIATLTSEQGKRRWTVVDTGMSVYTLIVLLSLVTAFDLERGLSKLDVYISWVLVYWIISTAINTQTRVVLMLLGWFLWNFKMSQHGFRSWAMNGFAFRDWGVSGAPGWFQNSGEFGIQMCVVMPISLYFALGVRQQVSKWVFMAMLSLPFTAIAGAIASSSRGALVGMAAIGLWMLVRSKYKARATAALLIVGTLAYMVVPPEQKARLSASGDDGTSTSRLTYWKRGIEFANDYPLLGIGYANWIPYYEKSWGFRLDARERVQLPHNLFIEAWSELGYTGLLALIFLIFGNFYLNSRTRSLARLLGNKGHLSEQLAWGFDGGLVGYLVSGFFVTVLYYPYLWVNLGMSVALHLSTARAVRATRFLRAQESRLTPPHLHQHPGRLT